MKTARHHRIITVFIIHPFKIARCIPKKLLFNHYLPKKEESYRVYIKKHRTKNKAVYHIQQEKC